MSSATATSHANVTATMNYCGTDGLPPRLRFDLTDITNSVGGPRDSHEMTIANARQLQTRPTLDGNGFTLLEHHSAVADFNDEAQVERIYYPEVKDLLTTLLGAEEAYVFGHIYRTDDPEATKARLALDKMERERSGPAGGVHVDFDEESIYVYVNELAGEERAPELLKKRIVNVNLWRGINMVERTPLAVCDGSTLGESQLIPIDMYNAVGPNSTKKVGLSVTYSAEHRWYYYPLMTPDEVLLFKTYDSDPSVVCRTPHSAFADPTSDPHAPPRHSLEIRALCFLPS